MRSRGEYYSKLVTNGIYTVNEIRALEEKNSKEGGDVLRFPVNVQTEAQADANADKNNANE